MIGNESKILFFGDFFYKEKDFEINIDDQLIKLINEHSIVSCNFEAPILDDTLKLYPILKTGPNIFHTKEVIGILKKIGINFLSIANNHIYDYGDLALKTTLNYIKDFYFSGADLNFNEAYKLKKIYLNNICIGMLSFCESEFGALTDINDNRSGYCWINHNIVNKLVSESKKNVDFLIIQVHAGVEDVFYPLPEWRIRYKELIDHGADVIIGHHPHVTQGWELYKEKPIFYSLGNFYFSDSTFKFHKQSYAVSLKLIKINSKTDFTFNVIPIQFEKLHIQLLNEKNYYNNLISLTENLNSSNYMSIIDKLVWELWKDRYENYYNIALNSFNFKIIHKNIMRNFKKIFLNDDIKKKILLLHNIRIESHRWATQRALELIERNKK